MSGIKSHFTAVFGGEDVLSFFFFLDERVRRQNFHTSPALCTSQRSSCSLEFSDEKESNSATAIKASGAFSNYANLSGALEKKG